MTLSTKLFAVFAALFLVAACETPSKTSASGDGTGAGGLGGVSRDGVDPRTGQPYNAGSQGDLENNVGDRVFFDYDSSVITGQAQRTLERQAAWLKQYSNINVSLEGHCDERGTREYNLALGERRANAMKDYLVGLGVESHRLNTISYGKERPAVLGSSEDSYAQNRRGVTVVE